MKLLIIYLFVCVSIYAQVDTAVWYPLHVGDKWEYYGNGFGYSQVEIIGDTLMPNGKIYYIFSDGVYAWRFQRKENNDIVYGYNYTNNTEYILFDFNVEDKNLWTVPFDHYWGIFDTKTDNLNLQNSSTPYKIFERAIIDTTINPSDTTWGYLIDAYPTRITKGWGITSYVYDLNTLVGAEINGISYGTLVGVNKDNNINISKSYWLYQNYPNPFNPTTIIKYFIPEASYITIGVYNTLGENIKILVNNYKRKGEHSVSFDGINLPSGMYYVRMNSGKFNQTIKAILIR